MRDPARELHHLQAAHDLTEGVGEDLAVLGGDDRGELVLAGVEQLPEGEQHARAHGERGVPPLAEGPVGRLDGEVHLRGGGKLDLAGHRPGRGVVDLAGTPRELARGLAVDPVRDALGHGRSNLAVAVWW